MGACNRLQLIAGQLVRDGCMAFASSPNEERLCEACGCHRSFHEKEKEKEQKKTLLFIPNPDVPSDMIKYNWLRKHPVYVEKSLREQIEEEDAAMEAEAKKAFEYWEDVRAKEEAEMEPRKFIQVKVEHDEVAVQNISKFPVKTPAVVHQKLKDNSTSGKSQTTYVSGETLLPPSVEKAQAKMNLQTDKGDVNSEKEKGTPQTAHTQMDKDVMEASSKTYVSGETLLPPSVEKTQAKQRVDLQTDKGNVNSEKEKGILQTAHTQMGKDVVEASSKTYVSGETMLPPSVEKTQAKQRVDLQTDNGDVNSAPSKKEKGTPQTTHTEMDMDVETAEDEDNVEITPNEDALVCKQNREADMEDIPEEDTQVDEKDTEAKGQVDTKKRKRPHMDETMPEKLKQSYQQILEDLPHEYFELTMHEGDWKVYCHACDMHVAVDAKRDTLHGFRRHCHRGKHLDNKKLKRTRR